MATRTENRELSIWQDALIRVRALDAAMVAASPDLDALFVQTSAWLAAQTEVPRLAELARLLRGGITRRQLWCVLVPIERQVARLKITDVEILEGDLDASSCSSASSPLPVTVLLDSLRSAFNVGGIFRTAECFGVEELVLCGYTATPAQPQVARAALGTECIVPWRTVADIHEAVESLHRSGIPCYALETVASAPDVAEAEWTFPCGLVLGNERFGLAPDIVRLCDGVFRIPLYGSKNSLNVVSSFAVAIHCIRRYYTQKR